MNPLRRPRIDGHPVGSDGANESAVLRFGRLMILLGVVNPPFWASIVRGISRETIIAGVVFSGLMIVPGILLTLIGRSRIARDMRHASGQKSHPCNRRQ